MDDLETLFEKRAALNTVIGRKVMTSIEVEGVHIPANSLVSRLHTFGHPLVRFFPNSDFEVQLIGSATGISYRGNKLLICTAHQLKGIPEQDVGVINLDKNTYTSSAGFSRYHPTGTPADDDARDLCLFEFTEQVLQNMNLQRRFFTLNSNKLLEDGDDVVGYLAYGCPFADQGYDLYENNHIGTVIRSMVCEPDQQPTDVTVGACRTLVPMVFDPNGLSGGPVFATVLRGSELVLKFAGVINRAGGGTIRFIKAPIVKRLIDLSLSTE